MNQKEYPTEDNLSGAYQSNIETLLYTSWTNIVAAQALASMTSKGTHKSCWSRDIICRRSNNTTISRVRSNF